MNYQMEEKIMNIRVKFSSLKNRTCAMILNTLKVHKKTVHFHAEGF